MWWKISGGFEAFKKSVVVFLACLLSARDSRSGSALVFVSLLVLLGDGTGTAAAPHLIHSAVMRQAVVFPLWSFYGNQENCTETPPPPTGPDQPGNADNVQCLAAGR